MAQNRKKRSANRASNKLTPQPNIQEIVDEKKYPFVLVLYCSDKTKGVVATKDITKKNRFVGSQCKAPMPIDLAIESTEKHEAFTVQFGSDVDFLYSLKLLKNGEVDPSCMSEELLAKKREIAVMLKTQEERKRQNILNAESIFAGIAHILEKPSTPQAIHGPEKTFPEKATSVLNTTVEEKGTENTTEVCQNKPQHDYSSDVPEKDSVGKTTTVLNTSVEKGTKNTIVEKESENTSEGQKTKPLEENRSNTEMENNSSGQVDNADAEGYGLGSMQIVVSDADADRSNMAKNVEQLQTETEANKVDVDTPDNLAFNFGELECSKSGEDKYQIAPGRAMYINKADYTSLPSVYPTKHMILPGSTAVLPAGMVRILLNILLPKKYWPHVLRTNIPQDFLIGIRDFLNRRLPDDYKINENAVKKMIYDVCRIVKRNRAQEKINRDFKIANDIQIKKRKKTTTMTLVIGNEEIPIVLP